MSYSIHLHRGDRIPEETVAAWRRLLQETEPAARFTSGPDWYAYMCKPTQRLVVTVLDDQKRLLALLPLLPGYWRKSFAGVKFRVPVYRVCGGDVVGHIPDGETAARLWQTIWRTDPRVMAVHTDKLNESRNGQVVRAALKQAAAFVHELYTEIPYHRLEMPPDAAEFARLRSRKTVKKIAGRERALAAAAGGACRLVELRDMNAVHRHGKQAETLMRDSWQALRLGHRFRVREMAVLAQQGWLRSFMLFAGDHAAAFVFGYQGDGVYVYDKIGYAAQFREFSPGTVLLYRIFDRLYQKDPPRYFDFGPGEGEYKRRLANITTRVSGLLIVRARWKYRVGFAILAAGQRLKTEIRRRSGPLGKRIARAVKRSGKKRKAESRKLKR